MTAVRLRQETFRAMGTTCVAAVTASPADSRRARRALSAARAEVEACERALSRFDPGSDLSRLNAAGGGWVDVDSRLVEALAAAVRARDVTCGLFDPTILPALAAAGYDRSFELLERRPARAAAGWRAGAEIELDRTGRRARIAAGAAVDLGGIGKGFSAARALRAMRDAWPAFLGAFVDLGGDIALEGRPPGGGRWRIAVDDPRRPGTTLGTLQLVDGGVATSGRDVRRFGPGGSLHHLIDPATGVPAGSGPLAVTVVGPDAAEAEAHATALAISALDQARAQLGARPHLAALYVPRLGEPVAIGDLPLLGASRPVGAVA